MPKSVLTFQDGKFLFRVSSLDNIPLYLEKLKNWDRLNENLFGTDKIKEAVKFRSLSDERTRNIFYRVCQIRYCRGSLPPLTFLDPHQLEGINWILRRKRSYLAHAPGAGKTAQAIIASELSEGAGQTLFIVPPGLTLNWEREINKFTCGIWPSISIVPLSAKQESMNWKADYIICPDSMLPAAWVNKMLREIKFKFIAVDEASRFKEPTAERSLAFYGGSTKKYNFKGIFRDARHVVFLDGSPMPNRPMELWAPTYALDPEAIDFLDQREFGFKYCGPKQNERGNWEFNHSSNEAELKAKLQEGFMHVVTEDRLSHPERLRSLLFMDQDVRSAKHKSWERSHLSTINLDDLDEDATSGDLATFRKELGINKIDWVARYVAERLKTKNESILLFAWHREVCLGLAEKLSVFNPGVVIGGTPNDIREALFRDFNGGCSRLIIGNLASMGRGHNLPRADRAIFAEYSWTDETNVQCEKRASRKGRDKDLPVRCEYIVVPATMDEMILNSVFTKQKRVKKVIG